MSRPLKMLDRVLFSLIGLLMAVMVVDVTIQVVFRYVVHDSPVWTEELARYVFAWQIYLATGLAFGRGSHILVDAVMLLVRGPAQRFLMIAGNAVTLVFLVVLVWQGTNMALVTSDTYTAAMVLNMGLVYAALPVTAAIGALYQLARLVQLIRGVFPETGADQPLVVD